MSVVLGYDESPGAARALRIAIEVAAAYGEELVMVYGAAAPGLRDGAEYRSHYDAIRQAGRTGLPDRVVVAAV
ncbi:universal stress protein, partial [Streptomyces sp. MBT55]|nr:universal stress protein [Streptomyces sp. MBT55]